MNFGADFNIIGRLLNYKKETGNKIPIILTSINDFDSDLLIESELEKEKRSNFFLSADLNFYSKLNPIKSNSGMYLRLAADYHIASNRVYPQALVGYSTNLNSFVNFFQNSSATSKGEKIISQAITP